MDKFWLKSYPKGVPENVDITQYSSVGALMEEAFTKFASRPAYECMGKTLSFSQVDKMSQQLGAYFQSLGFVRGDRIAIMMPNVLQYPIALAAVMRAGFIVVNVNPLYTPRELEHQLNDSGAKAIVILENFAATLAAVIDKTPCKTVVMAKMGDLLGALKGSLVNLVVKHLKKMVPAYSLPTRVSVIEFNEALNKGSSHQLIRAHLSHNDVAILQYTGGTTGISKGAMLLHKTLIANLLSSEAWMQPGLHKKGKIEQPTFVCALPMYHVFALVSCVLLAMRTGGFNILIPNPRDIPGVVKTLQGKSFNIFPAVNTLFNALANNEEFKKLDFSGLRISNGGGMQVQEAVAKAWLKVTGCPIVEGYGLTESCSGVTCNPTDSDTYTGTIGLPMPGVEILILDDAEKPVPLGERGEIAIRGDSIMAGYWNRPDETVKAMTADGFFKSGDIGIMDERGYITIVDRKKDMVLVSGFNVYPNEVEGVIVMHPGVLECAVIGVPDAHTGEAVKAFVVKKDPMLTVEELKKFCDEQLTGYKKPKYIEFRDELPKTNVGKILRRELREAELKKSNNSQQV
ncbi:MAG: long-chain-fatty-acid--CoA ligase [Burkholderiaceae bacterium]|nr:long-chain-fatty-acid--CoA ligase [Burkholderiaceae bacterium]